MSVVSLTAAPSRRGNSRDAHSQGGAINLQEQPVQTPVKRHALPQDEAAPGGAALERRKRDRSIARCHAGLLDTRFRSLDAPYAATLS